MANALKVLSSSQHGPDVSGIRNRANKNVAQWNLQMWNCKSALTLHHRRKDTDQRCFIPTREEAIGEKSGLR
jgi:Neuraminidase (sialidase)